MHNEGFYVVFYVVFDIELRTNVVEVTWFIYGYV